MTKSKVIAVIVVGLFSAAWFAHAEEDIGAAWGTRIHGGLNLARGNSRNLLLNAGVTSERKGDPNEFSLGGEINYGESEVEKDGEKFDETNVDNATAYAKYRRLLNMRNYAYLNGDVSRDHIADVRYRAILGPGVGRYFIKHEKNTLSAEIGVAYLVEEVADKEDDYVTGRAFQGYEFKVGEGARFWESLEYLPRLDDPSQYFLNLEVGAEAAMTSKLSLRVVLQNKYNSKPASDKKPNDLALTAGVTYKL